MDTTSNSEQIFIGIGNEVIELTGADKEAFIADREAMNLDAETRLAEVREKRQELLDKLGITSEEAQLLLGGN